MLGDYSQAPIPCQPNATARAHRLAVPDPFDFHLTAGHHTFFRGQTGADYFEHGAYRRVLDAGDRRLLATVRPGAEARSLAVTLTPAVLAPTLVCLPAPDGSVTEANLTPADLDPATVVWAIRQIAWIFALDADLTEFQALAQTDPLVAALAAQFPGLRPARTPTVFEALAGAIIGQQISGVVARRLRDRLVEAFGVPFEYAGRTFRAYPRPAAIAAASISDLRALGLTGRKAEYLHDIAARIAAGTLDLEGLRLLPNAEVVARLVALRGIGRWTAEWVLLRGLGRNEAFPAGDLALCRVLSRFYAADGPLTEREAQIYAARWGAAAGVVTTYLFAAIRQGIDLPPSPCPPAPEQSGRP